MAKERGKPLTREDVLRLIQENVPPAQLLELYRAGGNHRDIPAACLDLSGVEFEDGIDLRGFDLRHVNLKKARLYAANLKAANLSNANLEGAIFQEANLEKVDLSWANLKGACFWDANLKAANLEYANLQEADLSRANLEGAHLWDSKFLSANRLDEVEWGNFTLGEENVHEFDTAVDIYRRLKMWYTNAGMYDIAGEFFYREMTVKRKRFWWGDVKEFSLKDSIRPFKPKDLLRAIVPRKPFHWAWSKLLSVLCGYGERPLRVVISAAVVVLGLALIYFAIGTLTPNTFLTSLYYSTVSFTALGYGSWAPQPTGWVKGLGAFEAFMGVFMIALFLITFVRKWTR